MSCIFFESNSINYSIIENFEMNHWYHLIITKTFWVLYEVVLNLYLTPCAYPLYVFHVCRCPLCVLSICIQCGYLLWIPSVYTLCMYPYAYENSVYRCLLSPMTALGLHYQMIICFVAFIFLASKYSNLKSSSKMLLVAML